MSGVEWSIVAPARDQTADGATGVVPGWPAEVVSLINTDTDKSAVTVALETSESADSRLNTTKGDRLLDARAKRRQVLLTGTLTPEQYGKLTQFREDSRSVYLCPNFDESTFLSIPFFASAESIAGINLTPTNYTQELFTWDHEAQVMRTVGLGDPSTEGGPFGRYGRAIRRRQFANYTSYAFPTTTSTGWTATANGSVSHDPDWPSPVLGRRNSATECGVANLDALATGVATFEHSTTSTLNQDMGASLLLMTPRDIQVELLRHDGTTAQTKNVSATNGQWILVKLQGTQSGSGTSAKVKITATNSNLGGYLIRVACIAIGPCDSDQIMPDWVPFGTSTAIQLTASDGPTPNSEALTVSCMFKYSNATSAIDATIADGYGFLRLGSSAMFMRMDYSTATLTFDPTGSDPATCQPLIDLATTPQAFTLGDFIHIVCTSTRTARKIYVNGVLLETDSTTLNGGLLGNTKTVGYGGDDKYEAFDNGGMCLLRCDSRAWDADEVTRHYNTFGTPIGQAIIRQVYGRSFEIAELSAELFHPSAHDPMYSVECVLSQTNEGLAFAPVRRTEAW